MARSVSAIAHAKVNLHLGVGPLREDGYHELVTVFQSLSLHDELTLTEVDGEGPVASLDAHGNPEVPEDDRNLAWRAVEKLSAWHRDNGGDALPAVAIDLLKGIPTAGGMAGGSADAAATLRAYNALLPVAAPEEVLWRIAAELGSDVPFTLVGETQLGTGRGENLTPMLSTGTYHWALAFAKEGLSTPAVFGKLDQMERTPHLDTAELAAALRSGDVHQVARLITNDMQAAALSLRPQLRRTIEAGERAGALRGIVSGSGPTCVFLCGSADQARALAAELSGTGHPVVLAANGPVAGAHLVSYA